MKRTGLIAVAMVLASGNSMVSATATALADALIVMQKQSVVNNTSMPFITPQGIGPILLGMSRSAIPAKVDGLYDSYTFEQDEMGDMGDCYQFKLRNQLVAEAFLDADNNIYSINVYAIGAQTEDCKYEVGMSFSEAVAKDKFKVIVSEGPLIISAPGCAYGLMLSDYTVELTPVTAQKLDKLYETRGELPLSPAMVQPSALLKAISITLTE